MRVLAASAMFVCHRLSHRIRRYRVVVLGYVVMPEHFHLLINEPQRGTPSTVMQALKLGFTRRVLGEWKQRDRTNQQEFWEPPHQLWQPRFYDFNVRSERKRLEKLRYMHQNPVKRGLVLDPEQWRWSSFGSHFCGETGPVRINDCSVLQMTVREKAA